MAAPTATIIARASCDADDRLIEAQEPLAGLQRRCGGDLPGAIAIPELRQMVRKARSYGLRLARVMHALDGDALVRAWIEIIPHGSSEESDRGCDIVISSWQVSPVPAETQEQIDARQLDIIRASAELTALLDPHQQILTVETQSPDLRALADRMAEGIGQTWTGFVGLPGLEQKQSLHWRLLDGARCEIQGSVRSFTAHLLPLGGGDGGAGFELYLGSTTAPSAALPSKMVRPGAVDAATIARDVSPVVREPVARIIGNAGMIRSRRAGPLPAEYTEYAADIASAGEHLLSLLDDLSELDTLERGDFEPLVETIDLADAARRAAAMLAGKASERGVRIVAPAGHETLRAKGEFRRVLQILLNLTGNAVRYSPEQSAIALSLHTQNGTVAVEVSDEGPGLDPDQQEAAFGKFERLGRSGDGGSGLGLYISRRLARAMGGDVTVESAAGEGARFTLRLAAAD